MIQNYYQKNIELEEYELYLQTMLLG